MPKMPENDINVEEARTAKRAEYAKKPTKLGMTENPKTVKARKKISKNKKFPEVPKKPHLPTTSGN